MTTRNIGSGYSAPAPVRTTPMVRSVLGLFHRHRRRMALVFVSSLLLLIAGMCLTPRSYTSEARLFLRLGKESVGLDPTATMNEVINVSESRESEINSELEIMRSHLLLQDVVERLGPESVLGPKQARGWLSGTLQGIKSLLGGLSEEIGDRERAVHGLSKSISIVSPRKSSMLLVSCKAAKPEQAQKLLKAFVDAYVIRHAEANGTSGSHEFFSSQCNLLSDQLQKTEEQLRTLKNQHGMTSIDGQRTKIDAQSNLIEVAVLENNRALTSAEERIESLKRILGELPEQELAEESTVADGAVESMRGALYELQMAESEARSRFSDKHPLVIARRYQVAEMQNVLAAEQSSRKQPTHKVNTVHQAMRKELASTQATMASSRAEAAILKKQLDESRAIVQALNDVEPQIRELTRQAELIEASYRTYVASREQTRIGEALKSGRISNVNVVQPATFAALPSSPNTRLMFALAVVLATSVSVLTAVLLEQLDRSVKTPEQVELALGVPVFFSIPREPRPKLIGK